MFKGTDKFGTQDYATEKPLLDAIEQQFEIYRKTTDEAEVRRSTTPSTAFLTKLPSMLSLMNMTN